MSDVLKEPAVIEMQVEDLPWSAEDWAFNQIAITFEIDDQTVDHMTPDEKAYWAAFTTAVASLVTDPQEEDSPPLVPSAEHLRTFHEQASMLKNPVNMLHELAMHIKKQRLDKAYPYTGVNSPEARVTPELIYGWAIGDLATQSPALFKRK